MDIEHSQNIETELEDSTQSSIEPEKKKNLGQAHKVYQNYIDTNKKGK